MKFRKHFIIFPILIFPNLCYGDALDGLEVLLIDIPVFMVYALTFLAGVSFISLLSYKNRKYRRYSFWFIFPSLIFGLYCLGAGKYLESDADPDSYDTIKTATKLLTAAYINFFTFFLIICISPWVKHNPTLISNNNEKEITPPNHS